MGVLVNPYRFGAAATYDSYLASIASLAHDWKLDEVAGANATDSVGGNTGTYVATPTLAQTALVNDGGTAVTFDGNTQELTCPWPVNSLGTAGWLIVWIKTTDASATAIPFRDNTSSGGTFVNLSGTNIVVRAGGTDHTVTPNILSSTLKDGVRHMVVIGTDGTNAFLAIDGTVVDTWARAASWNGIMSSPVHVGRNGNSTGTANFLAMTADRVSMGAGGSITSGDISSLWALGS